jgi:RNA polymerase sigma factor (sigma-70 family)
MRELTERIASGDPEAFTRFYEAWFEPLRMYVKRLTGRDEAFCLDVVQDCMTKVIRSMRPLEDEGALSRWIYAVAASSALDRLRAEKRRKRRHDRAGAGRGGADAHRVDRELLEALRTELAQLDPDRALLLKLRHGLGWTLEQIGRVVGLGPGAVDGRIQRTLIALRRKLEESGHDRIL